MVATRTGSLPDCRPLLADPDDLTLVFRPVVDLTGATVAGYEALARFPGTAGPDVWFAAAADAGLAADLEALLVHKALTRLPRLPAGTFLLLPVRAHLLVTAAVREAFAVRPGLERLVVEVRATDSVVDVEAVAAEITRLRARGAVIALAADVRSSVPDVVVLDSAGVRAAGASDSDAVPGAPRLLADGIDTAEDLTAALHCPEALARGWVFGPPSAAPGPLPSSVTELVLTRRARIRTVAPVLNLVRPVRQVPTPASGIAPALELGPDGEPLALLLPGPADSTWRKPVTLSVLPGDGVGETLRLALSRPAENRRDPVLCTDEAGRPLGLLYVADLVRATAR